MSLTREQAKLVREFIALNKGNLEPPHGYLAGRLDPSPGPFTGFPRLYLVSLESDLWHEALTRVLQWTK